MRGGESKTISPEQRENPFYRIFDSLPRRLEKHRMNTFQILLEHGDEDVLFTRKEVVQAAGIRARVLQNIRNAGGRVSFLSKQLHCREDNAVASVLFGS
jgi:hypothetical protein